MYVLLRNDVFHEAPWSRRIVLMVRCIINLGLVHCRTSSHMQPRAVFVKITMYMTLDIDMSHTNQLGGARVPASRHAIRHRPPNSKERIQSQKLNLRLSACSHSRYTHSQSNRSSISAIGTPQEHIS